MTMYLVPWYLRCFEHTKFGTARKIPFGGIRSVSKNKTSVCNDKVTAAPLPEMLDEWCV
jgi:hypothetical protein